MIRTISVQSYSEHGITLKEFKESAEVIVRNCLDELDFIWVEVGPTVGSLWDTQCMGFYPNSHYYPFGMDGPRKLPACYPLYQYKDITSDDMFILLRDNSYVKIVWQGFIF